MSSISPNSETLSSPSAPAPAPAQVATAPAPAPAPATKPKSKPRKRVNTAEKRHQHNAIERARRETLNSKFLTLARLLPSLANHRRPSKSAIVNGSISHIGRQREQRLLAASLLKQLCRERDELFDEVNEWRKASGVGAKDGPRQAWNDDMDQVCSVEQEVFGNFASMDGDDYEGEDDVDVDGDAGTESNGLPASLSASMSSASRMSFAALPSVNGLITPRSSTDIDPMSHPALFAQQQHQHQHQHFAQPPPQQQQHLGVHMQGINWSQDFASQFQPSSGNNNVNPTPHQSGNTPLPFSAFMSDSTDSPGTSNLGNSIMLTPPQTADIANGNTVFTHTPSPRPSSASIDDKMPSNPVGGAQQWTPQQLLFLQQIQQHQAQVRQHQQNLANHYSAFPGGSHANSHAQQPQGGGNANPVEGFTQSLIATMFPQQAHVNVNSGVPHSTTDMGMGMHLSANAQGGMEQVQQWRKAALSSFLQQHVSAPLPLPSPTISTSQFAQQLKNGSPYQPPMLTPGLVMGGGNNPWSPDTAVEGF